MKQYYALPILLLLTLAACDSLPSWLGGSDESSKPKLPGTRISVLADASTIKADDSIKDAPLSLPDAQPNDAWPQAMGGASCHIDHPALSASIKQEQSAKIGGGNGWEKKLFSAPVADKDKLFAMDGKGYVSAHTLPDISHVAWVSQAAVQPDEPDILGGGLAFDSGTLFAVTGYGKVVAISPDDGHVLWQQSLGVPIRAAPKADSGKLIVLTVDNQTFALSEDKGETLWSHRGISETAGFISDTSPSIEDGTVVVPYSSGTIAALDLDSGKELWTDTLIIAKRTNAINFAGIGGSPVIAGGMVYAVSNNGLLVATALTSGQHAWEQEISSNETPWVAGDYVFVLSTVNTLAAVSRADGRVKWAQALPQYEDEATKKKPVIWHGPVLAGGKLWLAGEHGVMLGVNPQTGVVETTLEIPKEVVETPIIAGGAMYLVTADAQVYAYK